MTITLEQITSHKERLQREVVERECVIAGLNVLQTFVQNQPGKKPIELGSFVSALATPIEHSLKELTDATLAAGHPEPAEPPYMHPELRAIGRERHGSTSEAVRWTIQRMTEDFSLHDIAALLKREGFPIRTSEISVVLTRLRIRGEIAELQRGRGPKPAIFRTGLLLESRGLHLFPSKREASVAAG